MTVLNPKPGFAWKPLPQNNYIDRIIDAKLQRLKIQPSPVVDDAGFLRRVSLDLTGQLPTPEEVRAFVADAVEDQARREDRQADRQPGLRGPLDPQMGRPAAEQPQVSRREGRVRVPRMDPRLHRAEQAATTAWCARCSPRAAVPTTSPEANFFRVTRDPKPTMEKTTQVFLGVRMVCAQCHDHPFERWTQNQYYEMAAFFSAVGLRPGYEVGEEIVYDQRQDFDMKHPKDGRVMTPKFIVRQADRRAHRRDAPPGATPSGSRRRTIRSSPNPPPIAYGATSSDAESSTRSTISARRIPPTNPALLDALTKDFVDHNFDLRHLMRTIANSRAYQSGVATNEWNAADGDNFSHAIPRRLSAEELMDAVAQATGVRPGLPRGAARHARRAVAPTRTSARTAFWTCSAGRRANRRASASGAAISAFRRR